MEKVTGSVFNTAALPKFTTAREVAKRLRENYNLPVTEEYLSDLAFSGRCPAFFFEGDLNLPLFVYKDVTDWLKETMFFRASSNPSLKVVINPASDPHPDSLPADLAHTEGLLEFRHKSSPCVYFLVQRGEVVYVGQTLCLENRLSQHTDKGYDRVLYLRVPKADLRAVERRFIEELKPKYNNEAFLKKLREQSAETEA